jgi:hypothetical protein
METHVTEQPVLGELRQHILAALLGNPLFSEAEHLRTNHFVHECEEIARLTRWGASVQVGIARRAADAARQCCYHSTGATLRHLYATPFRGYCPRLPHPLPIWIAGAPLPGRADTCDRLVVVRFRPADLLTFTDLPICQS